MLFNEIFINLKKTALYMAIEINNVEIVKLLLQNSKIDANRNSIQNIFC